MPASGAEHGAGTAPRAVVAGTAALAVSTLPLYLTGAMAVRLQADLGFGASALGGLFSLFFAVAAVSSAPMGRIAERLGPGAALRTAIAMAGICLLGIATIAGSLLTLAVLIALAGMGTALVHPASNLMLARALPGRRFGLSFGIKQSGIPVATLLGGVAVPIFALTVGWRWAYVAAAGLALLALAAVANPPPADMSRSDGTAHGNGSLRRRETLLLAVGLGFGTAGATSIGAFAVATMVDVGIGEGTAGLVFALASCGGILTRVVMGHVADLRVGLELHLVGAMLLGGAAGYLLLAIGDPYLVFVGIALAFSAGWGWLGLYDLAIVRLNPAAPGAATGVTKIGAFVGGVAGPLALGGLVDHVSLAAAWLAAAAFALTAALCIGGVARSRRHADTPARRRTATAEGPL